MAGAGNKDLSHLSPVKRALLEHRLGELRGRRPDEPRLRRLPGNGPFPQSPAQRRLWLLTQLHPGLFAYNSGRVLRLRGRLDADALDAALTGVVERHDVLRAALGSDGAELVQTLRDPMPVRAERIDLGSADDPESEAARLAREALRRPFDLEGGLLLRARLLRVAPDEHVLVLVMHHAASDERSKDIVFSDLALLYDAARDGRGPPPAPPIRYVDYAGWEREHLRSDEIEEGLRWWRAELAGLPPELELPRDRPRPAVSTFTGARLTDALPSADLRALRSLAAERGATLFMVLAAGLDVVLARLCGTNDVAVGAPVSGRIRPELQEVVGPFGNTVMLRTSLDGDPTFRELVDRVRSTVAGALDHQGTPFERLVEELAGGRDLSTPPLAQVLFNFIEHPSREAPALTGLEVTPMDVDPGATKVDLALVASVRGDELRLLWEYSTELFDASTIATVSERLRRVLTAACAAPDHPIGELPVLSEQERASLAGALDAAAAEIPDVGLHELIAAHARARPDARAVRCGDASLSYRELDARARAIAAELVAAGVPPGAVVGVRVSRSADLVAALLGVHIAGCAYLPLDRALPDRRRAAILEDSGAAVVLIDRSTAPEADIACLELPPTGAEPPALPAARPVQLDDAAYLIYTSGSTGRPKGVVVEHRQLLNLLASVCRAPGVGRDDVLFAVTPLSFDIAALELLAPLLAGGTVVIAEEGVASDPELLEASIRSSGATIMQATPSTWRMLVDSGWEGRSGLRALCGGEALAPALADALRPLVAELWNMYGPTETTIWSTCWRVGEEPETVPIGRPLANTACYVLDPALRPVPPGAIGELCIAGAGVARGYHRRPELQAERFVTDPFHPGVRMYRTGDRARVRTDGALVYLGRHDQEVKLRGVRIDLGEVEGTIGRAPGVSEVAVVLRELGPADPGLIAYVTGDVDVERVQELAAQDLPAVMIPSVWVPLTELPRTANGKLDRARLPAPVRGRTGAAPPTGPLEQRVAAIWSTVLGVERIARNDDFFALGGHSLSATRLVARLNAELGIRLPLRAVFSAPTVEALTSWIERSLAQRDTFEPPALAPSARSAHRVGRWALGETAALAAILAAADAGQPAAASGNDRDVLVFPASFQQQRVWFLDRLESAGGLYAVPLCLEIEGSVADEQLAQALDQLVGRHEALRTTLVEHDGVPMQVVHPPTPFVLAHASATDEEQAFELLREEIRRPFDLAEGPLVRALLVTVTETRRFLALVLHHAVVDGWSLALIADDLTELLAGRRPSPPGLHSGDYALWQRRWLQGPLLDAELAWWRRALDGAPAILDLPLDHSRPAIPGHSGGRYVASFPAELRERIDGFAVQRGATPFMILLAAVQVLLARNSGQTDVVVGTPASGREQPELEGIVGYLANTLLVRTRLDGDPGFSEVLDRVKTGTLDALAHGHLPFDRLVEALSPDRDLSRNPLFQVLVAFQDERSPAPAIEGTKVSLLDIERGSSRFDLSVSFARRDGKLRVAWEYDAELFEHVTVERFHRQLECLLAGALDEPQRAVSRLDLMTEADREDVRRLLDGGAAPPAALPVHELVAARAAERPQDVAVTCAGVDLTYAELDARANRLAHALIREGVGPGSLVALLLDRSVELIVAIHGVLRAGGAYVPLDPTYPSDRLAFMLDDAGARILIAAEVPAADLPLGQLRVIRLDDPSLADLPSVSPGPRAGLDDLAYVIYTSGSTGRPKGVMIAQRGLVALLDAMGRRPGLAAGETMLGVTTPAFDLSVPDLYLPLVRGARLVLATRDQAGDPHALAALVDQERATVMQATPATWRMLLDDGWRPPHPMRVVVGGEAVPADLAVRLRDQMGEAWNFYGPTEATVWSTCWRIAGELEHDVPIGRPIAGTRLTIVDATGAEVPVGAVGELRIGGVGVARGYLRRPELTAERFVSDLAGASIYRTGDLVRLRADGQLVFLGRGDEQVKLRGFRIELGEITATLERHPGVKAAFAVVREDRPGDRRLVAYVACGSRLDQADLMDHLGRSLPGYMLPSAIVQLAELPLSANGKVDRGSLPAPVDSDRPVPVAPRTPVEEQLVAIWADVLGRDDIGVHDNLFDLGAHSLLVARAVARVRNDVGVEVPLRRVFEGPTVAELASSVVSTLLVDERSQDLEALLAELEASSEPGGVA